ncbi:hypothetical protein [Thermoactinospora rubra]|uniref:hypothetical protein n=1 Tax=Thermoactinospora rubra TaxID=1088767 RepID=UPI000A106139|nr:hypothetical protein [Thermoactinospora rubra]
MNANEPERGWFSPPSGQQPARLPDYGRPAVRPDQQVWPPVNREPVGSSTQPMPALPSAGPLPGNQPPAPPSGEQPPGAGGPTPPKKGRPVLMGVAAVAALVLAVGLPTADRYIFYKSGQPSDIVHVVSPGQAVSFEHVSWKAVFGPMDPPEGATPDPVRQWMKVTVTRTALDSDGSVLSGTPELAFKDRAGRNWKVEVVQDNTPTDPHEIGKPYTIEAAGVVPKDVADEVELHLRPNTTYRMDTPTEDLMKPRTPEEQEKAKHKDVFVFRR